MRPRGCSSSDFKRILIIRLDRIGDVLLSTPVIKALRDACPHSHIAMMVKPQAEEIISGNPYIDELILYHKEGMHKRSLSTIRFAWGLRKKRFDAAIILHPTNRSHIIPFIAGIPNRVGYNRKMGFLLTNRLEDKKFQGQKHELEYSLDVVRSIGAEAKDKDLYMPLPRECQKKVDELLERQGVGSEDRVISIHPGASCPSKKWPYQRFAQVGERMAEEFGAKIVLVSGPKDAELGCKQAQAMSCKPINLCGSLTLSELTSVLKRSSLFISNDSGPVHIAAAVKTPVISIFGRSQPGLSPRRWGPTGERDIVLHKYVGCKTCLAHDCQNGFKCLLAITVDEVLEAAERIIKE